MYVCVREKKGGAPVCRRGSVLHFLFSFFFVFLNYTCSLLLSSFSCVCVCVCVSFILLRGCNLLTYDEGDGAVGQLLHQVPGLYPGHGPHITVVD